MSSESAVCAAGGPGATGTEGRAGGVAVFDAAAPVFDACVPAVAGVAGVARAAGAAGEGLGAVVAGTGSGVGSGDEAMTLGRGSMPGVYEKRDAPTLCFLQ